MPVIENSEEQLRAEIDELKRQLGEKRHGGNHNGTTPHGGKRHPSRSTLLRLAICCAAILVIAFLAGYLPMASRQTALAKEAKEDSMALPVVNVTPAERSPGKTMLVLPGNIQAETEAPVAAHQSGYIRNRYADIGDHVKEGQVLAEIQAVELDEQVHQAAAAKEQAAATLAQANASLKQGKTTADMAGVTAARFKVLLAQDAVPRQDAEIYQSQAEAQRASVTALENAASAARSSVVAAEANLARLSQLQGYLKVRAPFSGVITQRNVDTGALVTDSSTLLFRIAQIDRLRAFVNVPQSDAVAIRAGQSAEVRISNLPSKIFAGKVTRTANALDPVTRTLLAEIELSNHEGLLLPGMYAQVTFSTPRAEPPMVIKGDTLVVRADGPQVAVVGDDDIVHYKHVVLGRDFGDRVEVLSGLREGERLVINPGDSVQNDVKVKPVLLAKPAR